MQAPRRTRKTEKRQPSAPHAVSAERVQEMLLEIAFALHATRVVGRTGEEGVAPKKG